jgi:hypothetical protein
VHIFSIFSHRSSVKRVTEILRSASIPHILLIYLHLHILEQNLDYICFYFPCFLTLSSTHPIWCMNEIKLHHLIVLHNVHRNNNCYYRKSRIYMCTHVQNEGNKMIRILISNNFHVPCLVFFPFMLFVMNFNETYFFVVAVLAGSVSYYKMSREVCSN